MVCIQVKPNSLEVKGHADFGPKDHDLVCAGISAIILGAGALWQNDKMVQIEQNPNGGWIKMAWDFSLNEHLLFQAQLQLVLHQLKVMSQHYPDYIQIQY